MKPAHILLAALIASACAPALASQTGAPMDADTAAIDIGGDDTPPGPGGREVIRERIVMHGPGMPMALPLAGMMHHGSGKLVKNAPYSAEAVNEVQQTLNDGNQIVNRHTTMNYRDSAGRMRHEARDHKGMLRNITIVDPAQGLTWVLNPDTKTAMKIGPRHEIDRVARDAARHAIDDERVIIKRVERDSAREAARAAREAARDGARDAARVARDSARDAHRALAESHHRGPGPDGAGRREEVRILIDKDMPRGPMHGMDRIGPALAGAFGDMKWASKATVKDLGTKDIDGIKAQGKMRSYEIPAGEIGNRNPIMVSNESWYAPDLQVTVMTRHSDPRSGERTYRLASIKRDEPAASLFTVPPDYTVKDTMAEIRKSIEIRKEAGKDAAK